MYCKCGCGEITSLAIKTMAQVSEIRSSNLTRKEIEAKYNIKRSQISNILLNKQWIGVE